MTTESDRKAAEKYVNSKGGYVWDVATFDNHACPHCEHNPIEAVLYGIALERKRASEGELTGWMLKHVDGDVLQEKQIDAYIVFKSPEAAYEATKKLGDTFTIRNWSLLPVKLLKMDEVK